ncbi:hypothetical protein [Dokdonia sp.]
MPAKCKHCGYPYTNGSNCNNCGSNDPKNYKPSAIIVFVLIVVLLVYGC